MIVSLNFMSLVIVNANYIKLVNFLIHQTPMRNIMDQCKNCTLPIWNHQFCPQILQTFPILKVLNKHYLHIKWYRLLFLQIIVGGYRAFLFNKAKLLLPYVVWQTIKRHILIVNKRHWSYHLNHCLNGSFSKARNFAFLPLFYVSPKLSILLRNF